MSVGIRVGPGVGHRKLAGDSAIRKGDVRDRPSSKVYDIAKGIFGGLSFLLFVGGLVILSSGIVLGGGAKVLIVTVVALAALTLFSIAKQAKPKPPSPTARPAASASKHLVEKEEKERKEKKEKEVRTRTYQIDSLESLQKAHKEMEDAAQGTLDDVQLNKAICEEWNKAILLAKSKRVLSIDRLEEEEKKSNQLLRDLSLVATQWAKCEAKIKALDPLSAGWTKLLESAFQTKKPGDFDHCSPVQGHFFRQMRDRWMKGIEDKQKELESQVEAMVDKIERELQQVPFPRAVLRGRLVNAEAYSKRLRQGHQNLLSNQLNDIIERTRKAQVDQMEKVLAGWWMGRFRLLLNTNLEGKMEADAFQKKFIEEQRGSLARTAMRWDQDQNDLRNLDTEAWNSRNQMMLAMIQVITYLNEYPRSETWPENAYRICKNHRMDLPDDIQKLVLEKIASLEALRKDA